MSQIIYIFLSFVIITAVTGIYFCNSKALSRNNIKIIFLFVKQSITCQCNPSFVPLYGKSSLPTSIVYSRYYNELIPLQHCF